MQKSNNRLYRNRGGVQSYQRTVESSSFIEVRNPHTNKLICKYDPVRQLLQHQEKGVPVIIDLSQYRVDIEQTF